MKIKLSFISVIVLCQFLFYCSKDTALHNWWSKKDTPDTLYRNSPIGFALAGKIYVGLGYNDKIMTDWSQYDVSRGAWTSKSDFQGTPRVNAFYTSDEQYGYIGMGFTSDYTSSPWILNTDIWQYDPIKDSWMQLTSVPFAGATSTPASFAVDGKLFVTHNKELWAFDLTAKSWQRRNDVPFTEASTSLYRESKKAFVISGEVFFLFNELTDPQTGYPYTSIWKYNFLTDTWKPIKTGIFTGNVDCRSAFAISGVIYMNSDFNVWYSINIMQSDSALKHIAYLDLSTSPSSAVAAAGDNHGYIFLSSREFWKYIP